MIFERELELAFQHLNNGDHQTAATLFDRILQREQHNFAALNGHGLIALQQNKLSQSVSYFERSLAINPQQPFAQKMLGIVLGAAGDFDASLRAFAAAIMLDSKDPEIYFNRANVQYQRGCPLEALSDLDKAIMLRESYLEARSNRANLYIQLNDFTRAEKDLSYLVGKLTNNPDIWVALGLAKHKLGKSHEAMRCNANALMLFPGHPDALLNNSGIHYDQGNYAEALVWAERAASATPSRAEAFCSKAQALMAMNQISEAVGAYEAAIHLDSSNLSTILRLGAAYSNQKRPEAANEIYRHALRLYPDNAELSSLLGDNCLQIGNLAECINAYQHAIQSDPSREFAWNNLGVALSKLGRHREALECYQEAIKLNPKNSQAIFNSAGALELLRRFDDSKHAYEKAILLDSSVKWMQGNFLFLLAKICDWEAYELVYTELVHAISQKANSSNPFPLLSSPSNLIMQKTCSEVYSLDKFSNAITSVDQIFDTSNTGKISIAYISSDFYNHATAYLMAELFELHDRSRFEIIGVCYGRSPKDEMRARISSGFDYFLEVADKSDVEIAQMLREMKVNIAVDLKGHTQDSRLGILAAGAAPIQLHYLGYPGTLGADFVDYLVADPTLIPIEHQKFYSEKIVYLPDTYQVNDRSRAVANVEDTRLDHGLPETGFVFCCFNNNWKITPDIFDVWMRLLKLVDASVLWLFEDNEIAAKNLKIEAERRGVAAGRLIFAKKMPLNLHLARHRYADLFLDTLYYNAHTTASDALWVGIPLITKLGETYASRVGASLLRACGMSEMVVESIEDYEALAIDLATNPDRLKSIKQKLKVNRSTTPLFDTPRFTANLELAYEAIWARHQAGLEPDHIYI